MAEHEKRVEIVVVVSGQPERIKISVHKTLKDLIHEALNRSGNHGQPPSGWDLRTEDGRLLDQGTTLAAAHIESGMTLFLSPHAGAGG